MNKTITPILFVLIGVAVFTLYSRKTKQTLPPEEQSMAQIILASHIEDHLSWKYISRLLETLAEVGCVDVDINGFYWDSHPCLVYSALPRYKDFDEIILPYLFSNSNNQVVPNPSEQYDLKKIYAWCKRNQNKYAQIKFGSDVRFNAVREITNIFHNQKINFYLLRTDDEFDTQSIQIKLHESPTRKQNAQLPLSPSKTKGPRGQSSDLSKVKKYLNPRTPCVFHLCYC